MNTLLRNVYSYYAFQFQRVLWPEGLYYFTGAFVLRGICPFALCPGSVRGEYPRTPGIEPSTVRLQVLAANITAHRQARHATESLFAASLGGLNIVNVVAVVLDRQKAPYSTPAGLRPKWTHLRRRTVLTIVILSIRRHGSFAKFRVYGTPVCTVCAQRVKVTHYMRQHARFMLSWYYVPLAPS